MDYLNNEFNYIITKFPKKYVIKNTRYLRGLAKAFASGDAYIEELIEAVRDNLVVPNASGPYLDRRAALYGIVRSEGTGILDPDFRKLIPLLGPSPKLISNILLQIIDAFYGPYTSHANLTSTVEEPYHLISGNKLVIRVDNTQEIITFTNQDAVDLSNATANEIATAILTKTNGRIIGSTLTDTRTGKSFLNIRTATIGSQGFLSVLGGDAQTQLQFPNVRPLSGTIATWSITRYQGTSEMIYTVIAGPAPNLFTAGIVRGDSVIIRSDSGFSPANTGTFVVSAVGTNYFRLINPNGVIQPTANNIHTDDFLFFAPTLANVLTSSRPAALVQIDQGELIVILPVTSPIVKRTILGGHHFHQGATEVLSATSNSLTLGTLNGFDATSGAIKPAISRLSTRGVVSTFSTNSITLINAQNWPTRGAIWVANVRQFFYYNGVSGNILQNVTPSPTAQIVGEKAIYNELYAYGATAGTTLTSMFPNVSALTAQTIYAAGAITNTNFPGSFLFDPTTSFTPKADLCRVQEDITQGSVRTLIGVDDVSSFPNAGYVMIEFGTAQAEGPIKYLAKVGTTGLILDPSYIFALDHMAGVGMRLVSIGPYTPRTNGQDLAIYSTSTSPARAQLTTYLADTSAAGVVTKFEIQVPPQKWPVLPNLYSSDPLSTSLTG